MTSASIQAVKAIDVLQLGRRKPWWDITLFCIWLFLARMPFWNFRGNTAVWDRNNESKYVRGYFSKKSEPLHHLVQIMLLHRRFPGETGSLARRSLSPWWKTQLNNTHKYAEWFHMPDISPLWSFWSDQYILSNIALGMCLCVGNRQMNLFCFVLFIWKQYCFFLRFIYCKNVECSMYGIWCVYNNNNNNTILLWSACQHATVLEVCIYGFQAKFAKKQKSMCTIFGELK